MKLHPLHPVSVHAPVACVVFAPLADLGAAMTGRGDLWIVGAVMTAGAVLFGLIAASFGALDYERAHAKAPKTVGWHAVMMSTAVTLDAVSVFGRCGHGFVVLAPPTAWAIAASALALVAAGVGGYLGGDLVYRHGVNVEGR